ncbi:metallophosphoesterase [Flavobacteriaceae bacterium F89]|uniref:Metallophosphoesterase n=1 Tax=Cerina litoralis TaxID=2874477 RepID=A0AAE3EWI7_9FLAO|nr:metallophosphoesterase [Cerina litoralis]MCG2461006.1 metallophosphoesterase [Cerina litoralis]
MNRRNFILKILSFFSLIIGLVVLDAFWFERYIIQWNVFDISDRDTGKIKTIQLTDLHIDEIRSFHHSIAKRINREQPDLLFFTGDSVNRTSKLHVFNELLNLIDPKIQKIAVMGNKEYEANVDIDLFKKILEAHNGKLLINETLEVKLKGRTINVIGLDDYIGSNSDYYTTAKNLDKSMETIVLNHCPQYRDDIERINRDLKLNLTVLLCGHTHGGQITFFGQPFITPRGSGRYVKGWYRSKETQMYVSKGIGTTYYPIRFWCRAEATIFYV